MFASAMQQRSHCPKPFQALLYISTTWRRAATLQRVTPREGAGRRQHDQLIACRQQRRDSPSVDERRKLDNELTPGGGIRHERVPRVLLIPPLGARAHDQLLVDRLHAQVVQVVLAGEVEHELELVAVVAAVLTDERAVAVGGRAERQRRLHEDGRVLGHVERAVVDAAHETPDVDARRQVALRDQRAALVEAAHAQRAVLHRHAHVVDRVRPDVDARAERARSARQPHVRFRLHRKQPRRRVRRRARTGARTAVGLADGGELLAQFVLTLLVLHAHGAVESRRRAVIRDLARRQRPADAWDDGNALAATDLSAGAVGGRVLMTALLFRTAADELESPGQFKERLLPRPGAARRRARSRGHPAPAGGVDGTRRVAPGHRP